MMMSGYGDGPSQLGVGTGPCLHVLRSEAVETFLAAERAELSFNLNVILTQYV